MSKDIHETFQYIEYDLVSVGYLLQNKMVIIFLSDQELVQLGFAQAHLSPDYDRQFLVPLTPHVFRVKLPLIL